MIFVGALAAALAVNVALWLAQGSFALGGAFGGFLLGPNTIRVEAVVMENGELHDYRFDRGRIRAVAPGSLTLLERDGTVATIPVAATAKITLNGATVPLSSLRRGMKVATIRDGENPADRIQATGR